VFINEFMFIINIYNFLGNPQTLISFRLRRAFSNTGYFASIPIANNPSQASARHLLYLSRTELPWWSKNKGNFTFAEGQVNLVYLQKFPL